MVSYLLRFNLLTPLDYAYKSNRNYNSYKDNYNNYNSKDSNNNKFFSRDADYQYGGFTKSLETESKEKLVHIQKNFYKVTQNALTLFLITTLNL